MKILLVRPSPSPETIGLQHVMICEPLELEYLAGKIADLGHRVDIVDMILEGRSFASLLQHFTPDLVAFTAYISHVSVIKEMAAAVKNWSSPCKTVVGGVHAEVVPEDFQDRCIDVIVRANGLTTFRSLVICLEQGREYDTIPGIWKQDQLPPVKETSFVEHPFPDRRKVAHYRSRYHYLFHNPCALIKTSFGCPFHCNFCFCREITDHHYFERPITEIMAELGTIPEREIYIVDDNFLVSRKRVLAFCDALEKQNSQKRFLIYGRADFIAGNPDVIERFSKNGLRAVIVGLESCRDEDLKKYNKKADIGINEKAVAILARYDVDCYATMILGMDWGIEDFQALGRWLLRMKLSFVNLQPFTPLKGTAIGDQYDADLRTPREEYEKWDLAHLVLRPSKLSVSRYYFNIIKLYYQVSFRPASLFRLLRRFGLLENLRLASGSTRVSLQYMKKVLRNVGKNR